MILNGQAGRFFMYLSMCKKRLQEPSKRFSQSARHSFSFKLVLLNFRFFQVFFILLVTILPYFVAYARRLCFPTSEFSSDLIKGKWMSIEGKIPANSKCDNSGERSCSAKNKAKFAQPKRYEVSNCYLPEFDEWTFEKFLGNRSIYFVGDSVMMQQKTRLQCDLNNITNIHGIRISHAKHFKNGLRRLGRIPHNSIVLMNVGLHYNNPDHYLLFLRDFEDTCLKKSCTKGKLIWQETAAQHFPRSHNGYFQSRGRCLKGCTKLKRSKLISGDFRNRMANDIILKYGLPILPTFEITQDAHDMHTQFNSKTGICDCTHYCNVPHGVFRAYNRVLQAFLESYDGFKI